MLIKVNQKLTLISIAELTGHTVKREVKITNIIDNRPVYTVKGKSKEYFLEAGNGVLMLDGWSLPLTVDSETNSVAANGGYNFVTTNPAMLRKFIQMGNINERFDREHLIMYVHPTDPEQKYKYLFEVS